ncbi:hypothetical protein [Winogradskyella pulchriflava]|uniref:Lipocalin-like domain-containing protein n=1 Tax=Winogradskyella pulchriflava TaxID=1110688 RepID=A0ABV6QAB1_9FLAO
MIKRHRLLYVYMVLLFGLSCHDEPYEGDFPTENNACLLAEQATADAAASFAMASDDNFSLFCQIYRDALENQIEICGDGDGSLQLLLDNLGNCSDEDLCAEAIAATEIAQNNYENATDNNSEALCNVYKDALMYQIEVCGDDSLLQAILEELGDCESEFVDTVGTWKLVGWVTNVLRDIDNDGIVTNNYLDEIDCYDNETLTFNADGTGTLFLRSRADITFTPLSGPQGGEDFFVDCYSISEDVPFSWVQNANSITFTLTDGTVSNYFRNGNSLYVAFDDGFYATNTEDSNSVIVERVTFVYYKI